MHSLFVSYVLRQFAPKRYSGHFRHGKVQDQPLICRRCAFVVVSVSGSLNSFQPVAEQPNNGDVLVTSRIPALPGDDS